MKLNISVSAKQLTEEQPPRCRLSLITSHASPTCLSTLSSYHHSRLWLLWSWGPGAAGARGGDTGDIEMFLHRQSNIWWRATLLDSTPVLGEIHINTDTQTVVTSGMTKIQAGECLEKMYSTNNIPVILVLVCRKAGNGRALVGRVF